MYSIGAMKDEKKSRADLIEELQEARKQIVELESDRTRYEQAEDRLRVLHDLSLELGTTVSLDDTLRSCVKAAIQNTALDSAGIYLIDECSGELHMIYSEGLSPDFVAATSHYSADAPSTRLIMDGRSVYIDYSKLPVPMDEIRRSEGLQTIAVVPIQYHYCPKQLFS